MRPRVCPSPCVGPGSGLLPLALPPGARASAPLRGRSPTPSGSAPCLGLPAQGAARRSGSALPRSARFGPWGARLAALGPLARPCPGSSPGSLVGRPAVGGGLGLALSALGLFAVPPPSPFGVRPFGASPRSSRSGRLVGFGFVSLCSLASPPFFAPPPPRVWGSRPGACRREAVFLSLRDPGGRFSAWSGPGGLPLGPSPSRAWSGPCAGPLTGSGPAGRTGASGRGGGVCRLLARQ